MMVFPLACGIEAHGQEPAGAAELPRLVHLRAGAAVDAGPPEGWSHRVILSRPRLASGEMASLPESDSRPTETSTWSSTLSGLAMTQLLIKAWRCGDHRGFYLGRREFAVLETMSP